MTTTKNLNEEEEVHKHKETRAFRSHKKNRLGNDKGIDQRPKNGNDDTPFRRAGCNHVQYQGRIKNAVWRLRRSVQHALLLHDRSIKCPTDTAS